jgi:hypothetical protein
LDDKAFFYANASILAFSPWDLTFVFQRRGIPPSSAAKEGVFAHEELARLDVAMSPAHAKLFAALALEAVANYEKQFGPVSLPPTENARFDQAMALIRERMS